MPVVFWPPRHVGALCRGRFSPRSLARMHRGRRGRRLAAIASLLPVCGTVIVSAANCGATVPQSSPSQAAIYVSEDAEEVKSKLALLPARARAELASFLIDSLDEETDPDWEAAWNRELSRREAEINSAQATGEPAAKVFTELCEKHALLLSFSTRKPERSSRSNRVLREAAKGAWAWAAGGNREEHAANRAEPSGLSCLPGDRVPSVYRRTVSVLNLLLGAPRCHLDRGCSPSQAQTGILEAPPTKPVERKRHRAPARARRISLLPAHQSSRGSWLYFRPWRSTLEL